MASETLGSPLVVRERVDAKLIFAPKGGGGDVYFCMHFISWKLFQSLIAIFD